MTWKSSMIQQTYAYLYASSITIFLQPHIKSENLNYITRLRSLYAQTEAVKEAVRERTHSKQQQQQQQQQQRRQQRRRHAGNTLRRAPRPRRQPCRRPPSSHPMAAQAGWPGVMSLSDPGSREEPNEVATMWLVAAPGAARAVRAAWRHPPKRRSFRTFQNSGEL